MRYITHEFAHPETLDRARRWLVQAGFDPSRIEAHSHGVPRLAVAVEPGEAAEVAMLIDAAEASDPDGFPSFLELALPNRARSIVANHLLDLTAVAADAPADTRLALCSRRLEYSSAWLLRRGVVGWLAADSRSAGTRRRDRPATRRCGPHRQGSEPDRPCPLTKRREREMSTAPHHQPRHPPLTGRCTNHHLTHGPSS